MKPHDPRAAQAAQYRFPYHHLPHETGGVWHLGRHLHWGFEYLSLLEAVAGEVVKRRPSSLLDFGCGDGRLLGELAERLAPGTELAGVDFDERALLFARGFNGARVRFVPRLEELEGVRFDVVVASEVLEHVPPEECAGLVAALAERVAPSGAFVVTVPTPNLPLPAKHYRHFDAEALNALLEPHFELQGSRYLHHVGLRNKLVRSLAANRLFLANWPPLLRMLVLAFRRWVEPARSSTGARLLAVYTKR